MNWEKEKELLLVGRQVVRKYSHRLAKVKLLQSTCRHWHSWVCRKLGGNRTDFSACKQECMWERKHRQERVIMQSPYSPVLGIHNPPVVSLSSHRTGFSSATGCDPDPPVLTLTNRNPPSLSNHPTGKTYSTFWGRQTISLFAFKKAQQKPILPF